MPSPPKTIWARYFSATRQPREICGLGFVTPTEARRITYAETVRFEQIHERTYRDLGFEITSIDPGSVSDRVRQIKCALSLERT
jgi:predicted ATPase